jgi:hypothetical protein
MEDFKNLLNQIEDIDNKNLKEIHNLLIVRKEIIEKVSVEMILEINKNIFIREMIKEEVLNRITFIKKRFQLIINIKNICMEI